MFVYKITNLINKKIYIGVTKDPKKRWQRHCWKSNITRMPITHAIHRYGKENFSFEVLEVFEHLEEAEKKEAILIAELKTLIPKGYNRSPSDGTHSPETSEKIRAKNTGRKATPATIEKLRQSHLGYKVSEETKQKLSKRNKDKRGTDYCYERAKQVSSKYYLIIDPNGLEFCIVSMKDFCKVQNLSPTMMSNVVTGKRKHHKGWRAIELDRNKLN